jgi:CheY-like chemotaxis protein
MEEKHILLVDDDLMTRKLISYLFTKIPQAKLYQAQDTKEADEILNSTKINLILMDIFMPGKDGLVYALELKIKPETKDIPIVFLTEAVGDIYHEAAEGLGVIKSLSKADILGKDNFGEVIEAFLK